jgi:hypothetical protein
MRERPGSLAVPPFGAAEPLTVPDPKQPAALLGSRRSTNQFESVCGEQRESRKHPGTLDY